MADVKVYVLGPPTDLKKLRKDAPPARGDEVYKLSDYDVALLAAADLPDDDATAGDRFQPFPDWLVLRPDHAREAPFFAETYFRKEDAWRRIDDRWMTGIAEYAIQLDEDTNNTSLALAIELPGGRVLLFPGDAQVGNWESWHDQTWTGPDGKPLPLKAADLLARTALYKVGHHGSHNATLRTLGLELMTRPDLVAMLPVDAYVAHEKKGWRRMPFDPLVERLAQRTHERVLRPEQRVATQKWPGGRVRESTEMIDVEVADGRTAKRPLYVEYEIM